MADHRFPGEGPLKATHWTVQIMPDGGGRIRTKRITRRLVRGLTAVAALIVLLLAGGLVVLGSNSVREAELARLRLENRHLTSNLTEVEAELAMIGATIDELSDQDQRFRLLAGLPHIDPDVLEAGVGGPMLGDPAREEFLDASPGLAGRTLAASYDVDRLLRRVDLLSASMDEALDSVALHEELFLARPSIRPVQSSEAWISSAFSRSRFHPVLLVNRPHPGIDISAAAGTPILVTGKGVVISAGNRSGYGKTVEIDHGHGYRTLYAHAGALSVKKGQWVDRGDVLGEVGKTGLATAPHLHYEVLVNDRQVNPGSYMIDDRVH
ncbi:MAG: M23 family metallopeptidase [Gemmatimonadetes bacterium]|nr:M23 family metallopeptidase [Gemmatimonadota bacterium]